MHRSGRLLGTIGSALPLLACAPCRSDFHPAGPLAWADPVQQCAERRDPRPSETHERRCSTAPVAKLPDRPPIAEDVVIAAAPEGAKLVWVQTEHFADDDAAGPIALIEAHARTAKVHALGWLRAPAKSVRMELVGDWLVIHGESSVQLLRRDRAVIRRLALEEFGSDCVAPARFVLREQGRRAIDDYVQREFEIERSLVFVGEVPVIHERLVVRDIDPRVGAEPETIVREEELGRPLVLDGDVLLAPVGLWPEVIEDELELAPEGASIRYRR
jgi:hypothetical protein